MDRVARPDISAGIRVKAATLMKHLDAYLDELEWRFRDTLNKLLRSLSLEHKELIN